MSIFLKHTWQAIINEIWQALIEEESNSIFTLLEFYYNTFKIPIGEKYDILNNIELASENFVQLPPPKTEQICIFLLEGFYKIIKENYNISLADKYENNLKRIFEKYNLRYIVLNDCKIGLSIQGLLDSMFLALRKSVANTPIRMQTIENLEENIARLQNTFASTKNCIGDASNIVEGAVLDVSTNGKNTLTKALPGCSKDLFAHESLNDALESLYKFFSDQPGVRHAGLSQMKPQKSTAKSATTLTPPQPIRNLKMNDAILSTSLAISFASFIRTNDEGKSIIEGDI